MAGLPFVRPCGSVLPYPLLTRQTSEVGGDERGYLLVEAAGLGRVAVDRVAELSPDHRQPLALHRGALPRGQRQHGFQGGGRGLGTGTVREVSLFATGGLLPDRTIVLVTTPREAAEADRIESEGDGFRAAVSDAFAAIAAAEPARVAAVDADADVATVADRVWTALRA